MNKNFYSLGLMSGTSLDGIDASIIKSDGEGHLKIVDNIFIKYDHKLKSELKRIIDQCISKNALKKLSKKIKILERKITLEHFKVCKLIIKKNDYLKIDIIGFHGQTIIHKPEEGFSVQIGDSRLLSKLTKTNVVSGFRDKDILNGGQGAPLAPLYHYVISSKIKVKFPTVVINIGGIANITYIKNKNNLFAFDTGPGNYLIDKWVKNKSKMEFDKDGRLSNQGKVNYKILKKFLIDSYYKKKIPKSLDVKYFNLKNFKKVNLRDGCATLSMLTAMTICKGINIFKKKPNIILLSGGGRKNKFVVKNIKKILKKPVKLVDDYNFDGDFIESQAFAYLAIRSYLKKSISLPNTTGVTKPSSGGIIYKT